MTIRPGQLCRKVILCKPSANTQKGEYGEPVKTFVDGPKVSARIRQNGGREFYAAQQLNSEISTEVVIRYRPEITSAYQIKRGSVLYEVVAPPVDLYDQRRYLILSCKVLS